MSYIIVSNIVMAVMMLLIYFRYTHFRLKSKKEVEQVKKTFELQIAELNCEPTSIYKITQDKTYILFKNTI